MAKAVKSRLRRTAKVVEDTSQRKLSFYLKKNVEKSDVAKSKNTEDGKEVSGSKTKLHSKLEESIELDDKIKRTSPKSECESPSIVPVNPMVESEGYDSDVTEIPPTPISNSHSENLTVSSAFKFKRSLYSENSSKILEEKVKSKSEDYIGNECKKPKLSTCLRPLPVMENEFHIKKPIENSTTSFTKLMGKVNDLNSIKSKSVEIKLPVQEKSTDKPICQNKDVKFKSEENVNKSESELPAISLKLRSQHSDFNAKAPLSDITSKTVPQDNHLIESTSLKSNFTSLKVLPTECPLKNCNIEEGENVTNKRFKSHDFDWEEDLEFDFDNDFVLSPKKESTNTISVPKTDSSFFIVDCIRKQNDGTYLTLQSSNDSYSRLSILKGFWQDTLLDVGDRVTVISDFNDSGVSVIDNDNGFITINNDILISSTAITSTMFCMRKSVLAERFRGWDPGNQTMFIGNVIHDLFQRVVQKVPKHIDELKTELSNILQSTPYLHDLYGLGVDEKLIENQTRHYLLSTFQWIKQYQSVSPTPLCQEAGGSCDEISAQVVTVRDIEDNIWCPKYGIKGKVDLTVEVTLHKRKRNETKVMPLELKTGKTSFSDEHQGQVILYSLMMGDRLEDAGGGLLLYLSEGPKMKFIETSHSKERGLIQLRNELSYYFKHLRKGNEMICVLPEPISRPKFCEKCPFLLPCSLLETVFEQQISRSQERIKMTKEATKHLSAEHAAYFSKWYEMLQLEYKNQIEKGQGTGFWKTNAKTREENGTCIANLKLQGSASEKVGNRFSHKFYKDDSHELRNIGVCVGDFVVVSSLSKAQIAITMGTVTSLSSKIITVDLDKDLYKRNALNSVPEQFTVDLNHSTAAFDTGFRNLVKLMQDNPNSEKLRKCIIDKIEPTFKNGLKRELADKLKPFLKVLNVAQQRAVLKLLMAETCILLQGMPGTGKTATIVALVRVLVALGYSVLLTSYTNSAVDNILLKLCKFDCKFVRLGQVGKIHSEVRIYSSDYQTRNVTSVGELSAFYNSMPVIATTCLGMNHPVFKQRSFDYCIIDEASQIAQPACIGPLFHCKVFVLVGDSKQLPPVTNSKEARKMGFCESLFTKLESPTCTFELNIQYRMNSEIMKLANELTYNGKLQCGSDSVASATLQINVTCSVAFKDWRQTVFSNDLLHSVIFLDTDYIQSGEVSESNSISNPTEIEIVNYLSNQYMELGVKANDIGVISFYRRQVQLMQQKLCALNVEVNTVDQYQGRDKCLIIVSCVRSSQGTTSSDILSDERRLNVALTRARKKLVIVGSLKTLNHYLPFARLFKCLRSDQFLTVTDSFLT